MKVTSLLIILFLLFGLNQTRAQTQLNSRELGVLNNLMERFTETSEEGVDFSDLQTQLEYYMLHKINLNQATAMDLATFKFLSPLEISGILNHRKEFGPFLSIFELQAIKGLDQQTCIRLSCFVSVTETKLSDQAKPIDMIKGGRHEIIYLHEQDLQKRKGYLPTAQTDQPAYVGSPYREVLRYRFTFGNRLIFEYSGEKDKGEKMGNSLQNFFDFNSAYLYYRGKGRLKNLALGNFQANFGQGLTFGNGLAMRKSALVLNAGNFYETLRPYRSVNESGFLKGVAITLQLKPFELTLFASSQKITSGLKQDSLSVEESLISSVSLTGLHRTISEIANKNNASQQVGGLSLDYKKPNFSIGSVLVMARFDHSFIQKTKPYQVFEPGQSFMVNEGIYGRGQIKNILFMGELSRSSSSAIAGIAEVLIPVHSRADFLVLFRKYPAAFQSIFSNAFSEYGGCNNEEGVYLALNMKSGNRLQISVYADIFHSPWLRYQVNAPSKGEEYLLNLNYSVSKNFQMEARFKYELKSKNTRVEFDKLDFPDENQKQQIRFNMIYALSKELSFKTRFEQVLFHKSTQSTQSGTLFFQDIHYKPGGSKFALNTRLAWFDIDSYDARVYATESDVLYNYSIPQYQNRGWRFYVLMSYKLTKKLDIYLKLAQSTYSNVNTIGSGLEQISGNKIQELKIQMRVIL